jgi:hypothetical protein
MFVLILARYLTSLCKRKIFRATDRVHAELNNLATQKSQLNNNLN